MKRLLSCTVVMLVLFTQGRADQMTLKNGDRVTGEIVKTDSNCAYHRTRICLPETCNSPAEKHAKKYQIKAIYGDLRRFVFSRSETEKQSVFSANVGTPWFPGGTS